MLDLLTKKPLAAAAAAALSPKKKKKNAGVRISTQDSIIEAPEKTDSGSMKNLKRGISGVLQSNKSLTTVFGVKKKDDAD